MRWAVVMLSAGLVFGFDWSAYVRARGKNADYAEKLGHSLAVLLKRGYCAQWDVVRAVERISPLGEGQKAHFEAGFRAGYGKGAKAILRKILKKAGTNRHPAYEPGRRRATVPFKDAYGLGRAYRRGRVSSRFLAKYIRSLMPLSNKELRELRFGFSCGYGRNGDRAISEILDDLKPARKTVKFNRWVNRR